jgi:DNA-binding response OmpR family regulator
MVATVPTASAPANGRGSVAAVPDVLVATDSDAVYDDIAAALDGPETTFRRVRRGYDVLSQVVDRTPDLAVLDLSIGNMGGMATALNLRLEEGAGRIDHVPILMLLDRQADVFLAKRSEAQGWIIKPLDPIRVRKAAVTIMGGGRYEERMTGVPATT